VTSFPLPLVLLSLVDVGQSIQEKLPSASFFIVSFDFATARILSEFHFSARGLDSHCRSRFCLYHQFFWSCTLDVLASLVFSSHLVQLPLGRFAAERFSHLLFIVPCFDFPLPAMVRVSRSV
jgi:hypothetical protein